MSFGEAERSWPVAENAPEARIIERLRIEMRLLGAFLDGCRAQGRLGPSVAEALEDAANELLDQADDIRLADRSEEGRGGA